MGSWVKEEFSEVELGDVRLKERLHRIVNQFVKHPNKRITKSMDDWAEVKGAYRFFDNPKINNEKLIQPHIKKSKERINNSGEPTILCIQDTTEVSYAHQPSISLGYSRSGNGNTLLLHAGLCTTTEGVPLGLAHMEMWSRGKEKVSQDRAKKPIEEKESYKWIAGFNSAKQIQEQICKTRFVTVCDRESDIYDLFQKSLEIPKEKRTEVLVRSSWNRTLENHKMKLHDYMKFQKPQGEYTTEVKSRQSKNKIANLSIRFNYVEIKPPDSRRKERLPSLSLYCIYCIENNPPEGEEPISWFLLTTIPIHTIKDAIEKIKWYTKRWLIERFFRVLKTGCAIEDRQFREPLRLTKCLVLDCIVAWRILFLTLIGRDTPDLPASTLFDKEEWQALYAYIHRTSVLPEKEPSLGEIVMQLAKLGGSLGRKNDGPPGELCLWSGLLRLYDIVITWKIFNP
ncbi:IS4 family transposase [Candidatus Margulisiibacteriota bacterium]